MASVMEVSDLELTERGQAGFGSTGINNNKDDNDKKRDISSL